MHAVLRHFVDASRRRLVVSAIEMVKRAGAFPYGKAIFNGFQYISFREHHRLVQAAPERELRGNG